MREEEERGEESLLSWEVPEAPDYTDYIPAKIPGAEIEGGVFTFRDENSNPVGGVSDSGYIFGFKNISVSESVYTFNVKATGDIKTKAWVRAEQGVASGGEVLASDYKFHGDQQGLKQKYEDLKRMYSDLSTKFGSLAYSVNQLQNEMARRVTKTELQAKNYQNPAQVEALVAGCISIYRDQHLYVEGHGPEELSKFNRALTHYMDNNPQYLLPYVTFHHSESSGRWQVDFLKVKGVRRPW